mmetsp:Transcript_13487/g.34607  ORF Transcript_13487/g.34607 Transcript_13487/m.34607 type:complete len:187 (-) Transcript_13487:258-818(-)|eukprot:jgi/Tetstr1/456177/TSEL_042945.t1
MSQWKLIIEICLPIPVVLLALLCMPAPAPFRRAVLYFTNRVMSFSLVGGYRLIHVMMTVTGAALIATTHYTWSMAQRVRDQLDEAGAVSPNVKLGILGPKWRQERNFWIAVLCFTAWLTLYRLYHLLLRKEELETIVAEMRKGGAPGGGASGSGGGGKSGKHSSAADTPSAPPLPAEEDPATRKTK